MKRSRAIMPDKHEKRPEGRMTAASRKTCSFKAMMRSVCLIGLIVLAQSATAQSTAPVLKVSENGRFLVKSNGEPFFYLGDTAWDLFHRLDREEADFYLRNRAEKGFTVIQAVVIAEVNGLTAPNAFGDLAFVDKDSSKPNEAYFAHVDWIVDKAASYGLFVGILPTWGRWLGDVDRGRRNARPENNFFNETNAREYGRFLGKRYAGKPVIWILGGDRPADTTSAIWELMALGIRDSVGESQLITYHPSGGLSSTRWFHAAPWLDFHMAQSGHSPQSTNYTMIEADYALENPKPVMDSEPAYEYPPDALPPNRPVGALQVRRNAWWAVFAGAHGHTYGAHPIWQFYDDRRNPRWDVATPWRESLDLPGATQLIHLKRLILSRPYLTRIPDQSLLLSEPPGGVARIQATRDGTPGSRDATYMLVYFPTYHRVEIDTSYIANETIRVRWMDPRSGKWSPPSEHANVAPGIFEPPSREQDEDWVLVVDDASKSYPPL